MENQVRHKFSLVGLQRAGTNYAEQVLRATLKDVIITFAGWKHTFREETDLAKIGDNVVVVARHPVLWLQSCLLNSAKDIKQSRTEFFGNEVDPVVGFANLYSRFYEGWLEHTKSRGGYFIRYEELLEKGPPLLKEMFLAGQTADDVSGEMRMVPQSVQLSRDDLEAVVNRECSLPKETAEHFWKHISPTVAASLAYTFEEINFSESFSDRQRLRAAAYRLTEKPETLTQEDFELLMRVGRDTFQNDGLVLGQIGTKLWNDGDVEGAFDWLMQAVQTIRHNDNKIFQLELGSSLADYLELLSRASLVARERTLERVKQHYSNVRPKTDHVLAGKEWNLSLTWKKLGNLDLAIDHAKRAIKLAEKVPTRRGDVGWWTYHVGDMLASAGRPSESLEKFREAAAREPSDFRHHYALAHEYRRLKDRERMFETLNEAMRLNPNDGDIIGFKATALRDFDPGNTEIFRSPGAGWKRGPRRVRRGFS